MFGSLIILSRFKSLIGVCERIYVGRDFDRLKCKVKNQTLLF
jgi:hypothetical protein